MRNFIKHRIGNADHNGAAMNVGIAMRRLVPRLLECAGFFHDDNRRASGVAARSKPATLVRELPEEDRLKLYYKRYDYTLGKEAKTALIARHAKELYDASAIFGPEGGGTPIAHNLTEAAASKQASDQLEERWSEANRQGTLRVNRIAAAVYRSTKHFLLAGVDEILARLEQLTPATTSNQETRRANFGAVLAACKAKIHAEGFGPNAVPADLHDRLARVGDWGNLGRDITNHRTCAAALRTIVDAFEAHCAQLPIDDAADGDAISTLIAALRAQRVALAAAAAACEGLKKERFLEGREELKQKNHSCAAASTVLRLAGGATIRDVLPFLTAHPIAGLAQPLPDDPLDVKLHTQPEHVNGALAEWLRTTSDHRSSRPEIFAATGENGGDAVVMSCLNIQRRLQDAAVSEALRAVKELVAAARDASACATGISPMANLLHYHGEVASRDSPEKQNANQCGHAELLAALMQLGPRWRAHGHRAPSTPALCLLLVVSRWCCSSCRYLLPHIARLLKVDILVQCRNQKGELAPPLLFAWRETAFREEQEKWGQWQTNTN